MIMDDLNLILDVLPPKIRSVIEVIEGYEAIEEIVLDLGQVPSVRFQNEVLVFEALNTVSAAEIASVVEKIGVFNPHNRAGIDGTLHRISAIRNFEGRVLGLTLRVGRAIFGAADDITDLISSGKSVLILGRPGVGKTTRLRDAARLLSTTYGKRVMIVDTSNEIAGEGDVVHRGVGMARRMPVFDPELQARMMIEAVENHMPEVIVIDEIGTEEKAIAARSIAERGVQLIATAHGDVLEDLIKNPTISDLVGGIHSVVLGDDEARFRGSQKTVLERKAMPTFPILAELYGRNSLRVYHDVGKAVDGVLRDRPIIPEKRGNGVVVSESVDPEAVPEMGGKCESGSLAIFPMGINTGRLHAGIESLHVDARIVQNVSDSDIILTSKAQMSGGKLGQILKGRDIPVHVIKRNSYSHVVAFLRFYFKLTEHEDDLEEEAVREIEDVIRQVLAEGQVQEAGPRTSYLRRVQHGLVEENGLNSVSVGEEPNRRLRVFPK